jgi:hypothetical protein
VTSVLVQPPPTSTPTEVIELFHGQTLLFGREPGPGGHLALHHPGVSRMAGEIAAQGAHWTLSNASRSATYVVENPEGAGEHVKVRPRRAATPIPFEISRVVIPTHDGLVTFSVFAPWQPCIEESIAERPGRATAQAFPMDENAKYFLVLVALCEPRLRDESVTTIPSDRDIVSRLAGLPGCADLTTAAVSFHLDYLTHRKLRLGDSEDDARVPGPRRERIASFALRFDLVRESHLSLLPPPPPRGSRP